MWPRRSWTLPSARRASAGRCRTIPRAAPRWSSGWAGRAPPPPGPAAPRASGPLEAPAGAALAAAGLPVVVVNPRQVRDFSKASGQLAKTDAISAAILAHFADAMRPPVRPLPDATTQDLHEWLARRRQVVE